MKKIINLLLLALLCSTAYAQPIEEEEEELNILFESEPGLRLPAMLDSAMPSFRNRFDLDGDGRRDIVLQHVDDEGNPVDLFVVDPEDLDIEAEVIWTRSLQDITAALGSNVVGLMGFFDLNADRIKEAIFRSPGALAIVQADFTNAKHSTDDPFVLPAERAAVLDIDGDGFLEIIVQNPETQTVQVYGSGDTGTATEDDIARALHRLFQNYPNPFREATTIGYEVEQAGPVTITIYDILGRAIRTLVDQHQAIGTYHIAWDGRDAGGRAVASGTYFYRLRVREAVSSKQAFRIK